MVFENVWVEQGLNNAFLAMETEWIKVQNQQ